MSILIRGLAKPQSCYDCQLRKRNGMEILCPVCGETFSVADVNIFFYRLKNCPLVELPPHGRLIDADVLTERLERGENSSLGQTHAYYRFAKAWVKEAPTVIEAEE